MTATPNKLKAENLLGELKKVTQQARDLYSSVETDAEMLMTESMYQALEEVENTCEVLLKRHLK